MKRQRKLGDVATRIKNLRHDRLKLTQMQFAEILGVKKSAVSSWEQGRPEPSAKNYVRLASASLDEDDIEFFLAKAGIDPEILHNYADIAAGNRSAPLKDGVDIGPLEGDTTPVQFPGWMIPNPLSTRFARVRQDDERYFREGDFLLIDTSQGTLGKMSEGSLIAIRCPHVIHERSGKIDASYLAVGVLRKQNAGADTFHLMLQWSVGQALFLGSSVGSKDVIQEHLKVLGRVVAWAGVGQQGKPR